MTTEQEEAEAAKAAVTDASAMDKLMAETLDQAPPPPTDEPPPPETPPPPTETKPPAVETKPAEPPPPAAGEKPPELDDWEKQIESHQLPAGSTRQAKEIIKLVRQAARDEHRLFRGERTAKETLAAENAQLKAQVAEASKYKEELERYKPIVETMAIEQNPNLNTPYANRIAALDNQILIKLQAAGLPQATAKFIMENGGPSRFSKDSVSQMTAESEDPSGEGETMSHRDFWEKRVVKNLNDEVKGSLRRAFDDQGRVIDARDAEMRRALSNREQYFKDLESQSKQEQEKFKVEINRELDRQVKGLGDLANEQPIPESATPEDRKNIEEHNAIIREARANFEKFFIDTSYEALVRKSLGGMLLNHMVKMLALKDAKIAAVNARFDEVNKKWEASKRASNTSSRQSVQQQTPPSKDLQFEKNDGLRMEKMMEGLPA